MRTTRDEILEKFTADTLVATLPNVKVRQGQSAQRHADEALSAIMHTDVFDICWRDAGVHVDEDQLSYYPHIEAWELLESLTCPVPHERLWVEIEVATPFEGRLFYAWILRRLGSCGFMAFPVTYRDSRLNLLGTTIRFDADSQAGSMTPGRVEIATIFEDYATWGDPREFVDHSEMLSRLMRALAMPATRTEGGEHSTVGNASSNAAGTQLLERRSIVRIGPGTVSVECPTNKVQTPIVAEHHRRSHSRRLKGGGVTIVRETIVNPGRGPKPPKPQKFRV
ncbi:MAG: hypothetical protein MEQ84_07570 [Mesorhizobium sp.]|nr:hypothetical protein [Mesorhizobium sp.]